jgi:pimeloyl-ACP methyl ester carboxylesterase
MRTEFAKRNIPYIPLGWLMLKYLQLRMGVNFNRIAPVGVIPRAKAKILLIHGNRDTVVPVGEARRLVNAGASDAVQLWVVPDKGHSDCNEHPEFWERVGTFLEESYSRVNSAHEGSRVSTRSRAG